MDNLQTKTEKLLKYGKTKLSEKGVESAATDIRGVLDDIGSISVQPTLQEKSITITENGTTEVVADSGYDGLAKVSVEANVQDNSLLNVIKGMNSYDVDTPEYHFELTADMFDENITQIYDYRFYNNKNIIKVEIPDNVTSIGHNSFDGCYSLTSVTIGNSVTSIGEAAFHSCSSLTSINIPNCVTSIGLSAFSGCNSLTSITIPDAVTSIEDSAFYNCSSLTSITIPNSVTSIGYKAFYGCSSLSSIIIPSSVTSIGNNTFSYCSSLTSITIPNSMTSIGWGTFSGCSSLTNITIPDSVTSIGISAFQGCSSLTVINYQGTIAQWDDINKDSNWDRETGEYTIHCTDGDIEWTILTYKPSDNGDSYIVTGLRDSQISELIIPSIYNDKPVTSIGIYAFSGYSNLTSVTIGYSVTSIDSYAFNNCSKLAIVDFRSATQVPTIQSNSFNNVPTTCKFIIPDELYDSWITATNWASLYANGYQFVKASDYPTEGLAYTLNSDSTSYSCSGIGTATDTNITVAKTYNDLPVTGVKNDAFRDDNSITKIVIPNSITTLGDHSFYGCFNLATAKFANDIQLSIIDKFAFAYSGITNIQIPDSGVEIKGAAFSDCTQLTNIVLPDSVSIIETGVFGNCTSLSSIQLPNTMTSIPAYTFKGCTGLTNITIPAQVLTIGTYAFGNCSSLTKIDCTNAVSVPVLEDQYALTGISSTCQIVVPDALYDEWIAATNWVTYASKIVKASEYTEVQA